MSDGTLDIRERVSGSLSGEDFVATILGSELHAREEAIVQQILDVGNVPSWMRTGCPVPVTYKDLSGVFWALPDYFSLGDDESFCRLPLTPVTATRIADQIGAVLPTRAMVNAIWRMADIKLTYSPIDYHKAITSVSTAVEHNETIQRSLKGQVPYTNGIIAGHKKDVVVCKALGDGKHDDRVAIYGWCKQVTSDGWIVVQDQNVTSHDHYYADYSHGIRFIANTMLVNGECFLVSEVLRDKELCNLLSDEGPLTVTAYLY